MNIRANSKSEILKNNLRFELAQLGIAFAVPILLTRNNTNDPRFRIELRQSEIALLIDALRQSGKFRRYFVDGRSVERDIADSGL